MLMGRKVEGMADQVVGESGRLDYGGGDEVLETTEEFGVWGARAELLAETTSIILLLYCFIISEHGFLLLGHFCYGW